MKRYLPFLMTASLLCGSALAEPMITSEGILKRPDPELLKKLIRCHRGEKAMAANEEGAVTVEVAKDWIRVLNFYVNSFGELDIASELPVKSSEALSVPR